MWNPLKKKKKEDEQERVSEKKNPLPSDIPGMPDPKNMNFMERMAMKQFEKMSPDQREQVIQKALDPKNIAKNKDKILQMLDQMEKSGQMDRQQIFQLKKQLGLL